MRWGSNNRKSWSNSSWFFAVVSYLGTAVKRRTPEFPLHHISMQRRDSEMLVHVMHREPTVSLLGRQCQRQRGSRIGPAAWHTSRWARR